MKKQLMKLCGAALLSATLVACGSGGNNAVQEKDAANKITIWAGESNLKVLEYAADKFNEEKGEESVVIESTNIGAPDIYQKITTGLQAGGQGLPDIMLVEDSVMPDYLEKFSEHFLNVNELGFDDISGKFASYKVDAVSKDGISYGLPFDAAPAAVFYREDMFKEAGIDPKSLTTWSKYVEAAKVLKEKTGKKMLAFSHNGEDWVYKILLNQQGSFYFDKDGRAAIDSPESKKAFQLLLDLKDYSVNINNFSEGVSAVVNEEVATIVSGVWYSGTLKQQAPDQAGKWSAIPLPAFKEGENTAANLGGSGFLLSKAAGNAKLAYEFMSYFATNEEVQTYGFKTSGLFPSLLSARESEALTTKDEYFTENIWPIFTGSLDSIPPINYSNYSIGTDIAQSTKSQIMNGSSIDEAVKNGQKQLEAKVK